MSGTAQFNEVYPIAGTYTFLNSYVPATWGTVVTVSTTPGRVDQLLALNSDTVAHVITIRTTNGSTTQFWGSVSVPAGAGFGGVAPVDVLAAILPSTQLYLLLMQGYSLQGDIPAAPAAGTYVELTAAGGTL